MQPTYPDLRRAERHPYRFSAVLRFVGYCSLVIGLALPVLGSLGALPKDLNDIDRAFRLVGLALVFVTWSPRDSDEQPSP